MSAAFNPEPGELTEGATMAKLSGSPAKDGKEANSIDNDTYEGYKGPTEVAATDCESSSAPAKNACPISPATRIYGSEEHNGGRIYLTCKG